MKNLIPLALLLAGCAHEHSAASYRTGPSSARSIPPTATVGDRLLRMKVRSKLAVDYLVEEDEVGVAANAGVVTLYGTVSSRDAKRRAIELASETKGVRLVQADLKVLRKKEYRPPRRRYR
jgi:osmotically-inducible protein OsmY